MAATNYVVKGMLMYPTRDGFSSCHRWLTCHLWQYNLPKWGPIDGSRKSWAIQSVARQKNDYNSLIWTPNKLILTAFQKKKKIELYNFVDSITWLKLFLCQISSRSFSSNNPLISFIFLLDFVEHSSNLHITPQSLSY